MPVKIRKATQHMAMFSVDADAAQRMIDYSGMQVCRYRPGRAVVVLMLMHYVDGDLGQYHEYGTNVMVNPPGSSHRAAAPCSPRARSSIICPSTGPSPWRRGRSIWGYPKVHGGLHDSRRPASFGFDVTIDGQFAVGHGLPPRLPVPSAFTVEDRRCIRPTRISTASRAKPPGR